MRRREIVALLGGAVAWPLPLRAQQGERMRRVGVLMGRRAGDAEGQKQAAASQRGPEELHWSSPRNIEIEYRWPAGDAVRAQTQAKELVELGVDVILANGTPSLLAARRATGTIPIVFVAVADPVAQGFVRSLAQPGGMITGFGVEEPSMGAKWVEVLKEVAPRVASITVMFNPDTAPFARMFLPSMQAVRSAAPFELLESPVASESEVERAISAAATRLAAGLIVLPDQFLNSRRELIVAATARHRLPALYAVSDLPAAAGSSPTGSSGPIYSDARRPMWIASSGAPSPPTCRSSSQSSSSWRSISRQRRRSASTCLRRCLRAPGWADGRNIRIDYRWAAGADLESMQRYAREVVALEPDLILSNNTPTTAALLQQTRTMQYYLNPFKAAAASLGVEAIAAPVHDTSELQSAITALARDPDGGLIVMPDGFPAVHRAEITSLAARYRLPAVYPRRFWAELGGLLSYGNDFPDNFRRAAIYADRVLKGAKPSELPVQAPVKFELVINLRTAKTLGLDVPFLLQQRADEVIE